jgi:predicted GNAT superfamily acetyltransferase
MLLRDLTTIEDFEQVVNLERLVWGSAYDDVVPVPVFIITVRRGAVLIGAFADSGEMVGFVYSLAGLKGGRPMQWSHMLGVLDTHRNSGLGRRLKLEQRQRTIGMGLDLVEWTFDPLQALNAHLNFSRLGVIVHEYEENIYGESSSPLHRGSPTDRFVAEWWVTSPRVTERLEQAAPGPSVPVADAALVNVTRPHQEWRSCESFDLDRHEALVAVEIPTGFTEMLARAPDLAREWRSATREIFNHYFARGYTAVDFLLDRRGGLGRYLLMTKDARRTR